MHPARLASLPIRGTSRHQRRSVSCHHLTELGGSGRLNAHKILACSRLKSRGVRSGSTMKTKNSATSDCSKILFSSDTMSCHVRLISCHTFAMLSGTHTCQALLLHLPCYPRNIVRSSRLDSFRAIWHCCPQPSLSKASCCTTRPSQANCLQPRVPRVRFVQPRGLWYLSSEPRLSLLLLPFQAQNHPP